MFVASRYPTAIRATAIGTALSVGRLGGILGPLYGGMLLTAQLPTTVLFYAFAAPALLGVVFTLLIPRRRAPADRTTTPPLAQPASG